MTPTTTSPGRPPRTAGASTAAKADAAGAAAVDLARAAAVEVAGGDQVGADLGYDADGERVVTHFFASEAPGYVGWRWAVTVARASRARQVTVSEVVLLPGADAVLAPAWLPWNERLRPGDLGPGDLLPTPENDPRLEPGYTAANEGTPSTLEVLEVVAELGLGRERVLSVEGREDAAERWYGGAGGPDDPVAQAAPAQCVSCGFLVRLGGPLAQAFGVCANDMSPSDGRVVSYDHGCGAHSSVRMPTPASEHGDPVLDTVGHDPLPAFPPLATVEPPEQPVPSPPVDPTDPTGPLGPVDPTDPTGPTGPVDPTDPTGPVEPVDPTGPASPEPPPAPVAEVVGSAAPPAPVAETVGSSELPGPVVPTDPSDPVQPVDPTGPVPPFEPVEPVPPLDAPGPVPPVDPSDPVQPVDPTVPPAGAPAGRAPVDPSRPSDPDLSGPTGPDHGGPSGPDPGDPLHPDHVHTDLASFPDTSFPDTSFPDTSFPDTSFPATSFADTSSADTSSADTSDAERTAEPTSGGGAVERDEAPGPVRVDEPLGDEPAGEPRGLGLVADALVVDEHAEDPPRGDADASAPD